MTLEDRKLKLIEKVLEIEDLNTLSMLENTLESMVAETGAEYKAAQLKPMSLEEFYDKIDQAEEDSRAGNYKTIEEVAKHFGSKL